ncbi:MAG: hypothetical protein KDD64_17155 [Bdellovibrionales bacterium]|nr:hypothetical protein [Bdellovibrionales bacterium]
MTDQIGDENSRRKRAKSPVEPDGAGRIQGTSYPAEVAPDGSQPLFSELPGLNFQQLTPQDGDIIVVRTEERVEAEDKAELNRLVQRQFPGRNLLVVFLPKNSVVHLEPAKLSSEDRGYRETKVYGTDKAPNQDGRGVHTGRPDDLPPQIPLRGVTPHPESEGEEDRLSSKRQNPFPIISSQEEDPCSG